MVAGFVRAGEVGEEVIYWSEVDPRQTVERPLPLHSRPVVRSFRMHGPEPQCLEACRCSACRLVLFKYPGVESGG